MASYTEVRRVDWSEAPLPRGMPRLKTPVEAVFFGYTRKDYTTYGAKESPGAYPNHDQTLKELKYIVKGDMMRLKDTRFNFLLGNDGFVYEGRGWRRRPYIPSKYVSSVPYFNGIFITFIGDFSENPPSEALLKMREEFLKNAVKRRKIQSKFTFISMDSPWKVNQELFTYRF